MKEFVVYIGARLKVRANNNGDALVKAKEECSKFIQEIQLSENAIIKKEPFWEVEDLSYDTCIHGVPIMSGTFVEGFKTTNDPRCKDCVANMNGKCTANIHLAKIP